MSRVGKKPIPIPEKTKVEYTNRVFTVQGEKGVLTREIHPDVDLLLDEGVITVSCLAANRTTDAFQGMTRNLVANMVLGVSKGFVRTLEINGIGYRAEKKDDSQIVFSLGYSHQITFVLPKGISAEIEKNTIIKLSGIDKDELGRTAASIRMLRPPEPYKGKGIKYSEERIQRKAGKTGAKK